MDRKDIAFLSTAELSERIKSKEVSPVEATEVYIERIDRLDFKFQAFLTVSRNEALEAARKAEQQIAQGNYLGPMHGIPVAVKDQLWTKGIRSTGGSRILADFFPNEDATVIANLKRAGAIILGKTNLTEFALSPTQRYSSPRNPWNLDMYAGPSSSGSGAATAAFLCSTSLGEDTGGSIRFPATWCALVGVKPTWGLVSRYGVMGGAWSLDAVGPMSRIVSDAAMTLQAIAGHDPKDPYSWDTPVPDYNQALDGNIKGLRVGVVKELAESRVIEPEISDAVSKATSVLAELGASVGEVSIPLSTHAFPIFWVITYVEAAAGHWNWIKTRLKDYGYANRRGNLTGGLIPAQVYYKAQKLRHMLRQQVDEALEKYDVLVSPTLGKTAMEIQEDRPITSKEAAMPLPFILTPTFNLANGPALTLCCGFNSRDLPMGLQIAGRPGRDDMVFKVAHAYEQSTPWHKRKPPTV